MVTKRHVTSSEPSSLESSSRKSTQDLAVPHQRKDFNPWLSLLSGLPLEHHEKELVRKYRGDPESRLFLQISDLMKSYDLKEEATELLLEGLSRHPEYTLARLSLVRDLYDKGSLEMAYQFLVDAPVSLGQNFLAQKYLFKLGVLLKRTHVATQASKELHKMGVVGSDFGALLESFAHFGEDHVYNRLLSQFKERGVEPLFPNPSYKKETTRSLPQAHVPWWHQERGDQKDGFFVVPLKEVFFPSEGSPHDDRLKLDQIALGEIYIRQGYLDEALGVFQRLIKVYPRHERVRARISEIRALKAEKSGYSLNPLPEKSLDEATEKDVEVINRSLAFLRGLLIKLD